MSDGTDTTTSTTDADIDWSFLDDIFSAPEGATQGTSTNIDWSRLFSGLRDAFKTPAGQIVGVTGLAALLNRLTGSGGGNDGFSGYKYGIPTTTASRTMLPIPQTVTTPTGDVVPRRPGSGGITYFSPMVYSAGAPPALGPTSTPTTPAPTPTPTPTPADTTPAASGGLMGLAKGGRLLRGPGDGVSDSIPAQFTNGRPARLADGEFVLDARTVSEIGNGSTEAGARKLYAMLDRIHKARKRAGRGQPSNADKYLPK